MISPSNALQDRAFTTDDIAGVKTATTMQKCVAAKEETAAVANYMEGFGR